MTLDYIFYGDPEKVWEYSDQLNLKQEKGCAVCVDRDLSMMVFDRAACRIPGNYPTNQGFCNRWKLDEGCHYVNNKTAA